MKQRLSTKEEYQKQVNMIVEYINSHLDEDLDLTSLAEKANFSPFHFHRIMKAFLGESLGAFIVRLRIETAARLLRYSDMPIQDIAYRTGYDMPSSLSKSFKSFYGISPIEFRNDKNYTIMRVLQLNENLELKAPKIKEIASRQVIFIRACGKYSEIDFGASWGRLWQFVKENKLFSKGIEHICIYFDSPNEIEADKLRTDICLIIPKTAEPKGEVGVKEIDGGKYAVFLYQGPYENLGAVYNTIFAKWLPESNCKLRNVPVFEKYLNNPDMTSPDKLKTEIYVPIE